MSDNTSGLTHFDDQGAARMVDVSGKSVTRRTATAAGCIRMNPSTVQLIRDLKIAKGDVLQIARLAGIMAAKQTAHLIPLCHPISLSAIDIFFDVTEASRIRIRARVSADYKTGVEMEALTAVSITALTIYDMCKAVDKDMVVESIYLVDKQGGKSTHLTSS